MDKKALKEKFKLLVTTWDCYNDIPIPDEDILKDCEKCADIAEQYANQRVLEVLESCLEDLRGNISGTYCIQDKIQEIKSSQPDHNDLNQVFPLDENMR